MEDQIRQAYEREVAQLIHLKNLMEYFDIKKYFQALILHHVRRKIGIKYKLQRPEQYRKKIFKRNLEKYNNKWGPTFLQLKKSGKTDNDIIESALRVNEDYTNLKKEMGVNNGI